MAELQPKLTNIYAQLKIGGDLSSAKHLAVERVDYGDFGNSRPFRIRIVTQFNGNADHYYVKYADASRIYGLELEHILSPFRMSYLVRENTLIEEHIAGIPGDVEMRANQFVDRFVVRKKMRAVNLERRLVGLLVEID
ncbi:MAG: hypothetical protein ACKOAL_07805, partial [Chthoniobacterales bacterium]